MWAVGENCVAAMKFGILGFYSSGGQDSAHLFCSDGSWGPGPLKKIQGGGGAFQPRRPL